jgi:hypothetical protein
LEWIAGDENEIVDFRADSAIGEFGVTQALGRWRTWLRGDPMESAYVRHDTSFDAQAACQAEFERIWREMTDHES